ncbi:MAG: Molybdopterin molybdenumtransferase [Saprospiraceae bacterium]|nr:Molybdopterin molybdenumtransferase [Saprospiraceae bacterium]
MAILSVAEAEKIILQHAFSPAGEEVELAHTLGRILQEELTADRDFPPFDRVTMDGIAIRHAQFAEGCRQFPICGVQAAGKPRLTLTDPAGCMEVMTGAMLPEGADTVIRYEDVRIENGSAAVLCSGVNFRQNLHFQGIDRRTGDIIVQRGQKIGPAEIATAATVGKTRLRVARLPRTAIVSTGDELVPVGQTPLPHQIRGSNVFAIRALLAEQFQADSQIFHYPDDPKAIAKGLEQIFGDFDLVILSGAVSEGKFDFLPQVLASLGVEKLFHKVSQRPGKPFWFGQLPGRAVVFALPGNPVSAFMCVCRYLLPFLRRSLGQTPRPPEIASLAEQVVFKPALTYFLPVRLECTAGGMLQAQPLPGHGSGDLANLNDADGFLELPLERDVFLAREVFPFYRYR